VVKNSLEPDWAPGKNTFEFDLSKGELTNLKITVKDWNRLGSNKLLGTACITEDKLKALMAGEPSTKLDKFYISSPDKAPLMGQNQLQTFVVLKLNAKEALPPELSLAECILGIQAAVVVMCFVLLQVGVLEVAFTLLLFGVLTVAFMAWNWYVRFGEAKRGCQCLLWPKPGEAADMHRIFLGLTLTVTVLVCLVGLVGCFAGGSVLSKLVEPSKEDGRSPMFSSAHISRKLETCSVQSVQNKRDPCWEATKAAQQQQQQQQQPAVEPSKEDEVNKAQAQEEQMRKQEEQRKEAQEKKRKEEEQRRAEQKRKEEEQKRKEEEERKAVAAPEPVEAEDVRVFLVAVNLEKRKEDEKLKVEKRRKEEEQRTKNLRKQQEAAEAQANVRAQSCETFDVDLCNMDYPNLFLQCREKKAECDKADVAKVRAQSCETFDVHSCDMDYPNLFLQCREKKTECDGQ